jgi:ABC-2 type transport system ATP-binding protein
MAKGESIRSAGLSKIYGQFCALQPLELEIATGEVFGLLGPNGAGKTTLIRLLMGLLVPSSGSARVLGMDCFVDRVILKRHIGYLPDTPFFYDHLTGRELLRFMADAHGFEPKEAEVRAERLLAELQLSEAADDFATQYSLGMKKKLAMAMALMHDPAILILDEPTTGLDPLSSRHIRDFIRSYADGGRTVLLSTHWLDMAEAVCDRVGVIARGRLVACDSPAKLCEQAEASSACPLSLEDTFLQLTAEKA